MTRVYEYTRNLNGEARLEIVMLLSKDECNFDEILRRVGLESCLGNRGRKLQKSGSGLTFPSPVTGKLYGPDCLGRLHKTLLKKAGITENMPFHGLRHPNVKHKTNIFSGA